ncbi:transmembrane protein 14C isoform X2 [Ursus arctos]|uniref:transmembrane protein 14C isoform X2 n=1 Tax=Ursus arctos TaxID=9644 RepID=UPI0025492C28|nr:transmembrane protein 14C isoform X2 [Ursus arctos]
MQKDSGPLVPLHWIGFGYAALVASGGIIGYAKAGSVPSLAAGLLFGSLAGLGAYQLSQDPRNIWVFLATSGTLAGIMGMRFYHSGKFMPAGLIAGARMPSRIPYSVYLSFLLRLFQMESFSNCPCFDDLDSFEEDWSASKRENLK